MLGLFHLDIFQQSRLDDAPIQDLALGRQRAGGIFLEDLQGVVDPGDTGEVLVVGAHGHGGQNLQETVDVLDLGDDEADEDHGRGAHVDRAGFEDPVGDRGRGGRGGEGGRGAAAGILRTVVGDEVRALDGVDPHALGVGGFFFGLGAREEGPVVAVMSQSCYRLFQCALGIKL